LVTFLRAIAHAGLTNVREFSDPTALALLGPGWRWLHARTLRSAQRRGPARWLERTHGRTDLVPLRTRFLDDAWHAAHAAGTRQLVLLGAGLDGRAFRLDDIGDSTVFEVDHPSTQALKRQRARTLVARAQRHAYVPVDFERDPLVAALAAAGQRTDIPTFWIWEGVTPYLTPSAQADTLAALVQRSAARSRIAMTYVEPEEGSPPLLNPRRLVRLFGEPFRGEMSRASAAAELQAAGLRLLEDSDATDWRQRYAREVVAVQEALRERIALAEL
jgi:methyltransferase (TIGR00027 family)